MPNEAPPQIDESGWLTDMHNQQSAKPIQRYDPDRQTRTAECDLEHLRQSLVEYKGRVYSLLSSVLPSFVIGALPLLISAEDKVGREVWIPLLSLMPVLFTPLLMSIFLELVIAIRMRAAFCLLLERGILTQNLPPYYHGWESALVRFERSLGDALKGSEDGSARAWLSWLRGNPKFRGPNYIRTGTLLLTIAPLVLILGSLLHSRQAQSLILLVASLLSLLFVLVCHLFALRIIKKIVIGSYNVETIAQKMYDELSQSDDTSHTPTMGG